MQRLAECVLRQYSVAAPRRISIRLILSTTKKPRERLSGDQNGYAAFSVPFSGFASSESKSRTQSICLVPESPENAIWRPSGEITEDRMSTPEGGRMETLNSSRAGVAGR